MRFARRAIAATLVLCLGWSLSSGAIGQPAPPAPVPERLALARELTASLHFSDALSDVLRSQALVDSDHDPDAKRRAEAWVQGLADEEPAFEEAAATVYAQTLSTEVLRAVADFNRTPTGRGFISKLPDAYRMMNGGQTHAAQPVDPERSSAARDLVKVLDIEGAMLAPMLRGMGPKSARAKFERQMRAMMPKIEAQATEAYAALYTTEELRDGAAFYRTPEGQVFNHKSSEIEFAMAGVMMQLMPGILDAAEKHFCAAGPCTAKDREDFAAARQIFAGMAPGRGAP